MDALAPYLVELSASRLAGAVPETSGYGALADLLNGVGHAPKSRVRYVIGPSSHGAEDACQVPVAIHGELASQALGSDGSRLSRT